MISLRGFSPTGLYISFLTGVIDLPEGLNVEAGMFGAKTEANRVGVRVLSGVVGGWIEVRKRSIVPV